MNRSCRIEPHSLLIIIFDAMVLAHPEYTRTKVNYLGGRRAGSYLANPGCGAARSACPACLLCLIPLILMAPSVSRAADCAAIDTVADQAIAVRAWLELAACHADNGQPTRAIDVLVTAMQSEGSPEELAAIAAGLGQAYARLGDFETATAALNQGLVQATEAGSAESAASLLNDLGGLYAATGESLSAIASFSDSARLAAEDSALGLIAQTNLARALWESAGLSGAEVYARADELGNRVAGLDSGGARTSLLLSVAELAREAVETADGNFASRARRRVYDLLALAVDDARRSGEDRQLAFAFAYLGRVYEDAGEPDEALRFTRRAVAIAQRLGESDSLYRFEWQLGRLLRASGDRAEAERIYSQAVASLARLGPSLAMSDRRFERDISPLYREYADVRLAGTAGLSAEARRSTLTEVQSVLERFRLSEVQNYFENQCVLSEIPGSLSPGDSVAVIYPILLDDRMELLVAAGEELAQFTVDVGLADLTSRIRQLRSAIENAESESSWLPRAQALERLLIAPASELLNRFTPRTLVFVPDGPLRTLPFAVLHDGSRFLVERYALSVTPGLSLIDATDSARGYERVLANGLVESVQGFAALPNVATELESIAGVLPARTLADEEFLLTSVEDEILAGEFSIVHMATHAQFEADFRNSFLLTYDGLVTMNELEDMMSIQRYSEQPVDLLILSACQTAAGDDRAALGLAGVAIKAGARSALASLWLINDESTAVLMAEFYQQLVGGGQSRADALRGAQLRLLNDPAYSHPTYWAPFLMIGDWR